MLSVTNLFIVTWDIHSCVCVSFYKHAAMATYTDSVTAEKIDVWSPGNDTVLSGITTCASFSVWASTVQGEFLPCDQQGSVGTFCVSLVYEYLMI